MDNRPENRVALCRLCHNLREDKKPCLEDIRHLRAQTDTDDSRPDGETPGKPSAYLAGSMDTEGFDGDHTWRSPLTEHIGSRHFKINSPKEATSQHGAGIVSGVAGEDMRLIDNSDAIIAYFNKKEQVGTLTELVYAVSQNKPALVFFDTALVPAERASDGIELECASPVYWFLINFLTGDGWDGLEANITVETIDNLEQMSAAVNVWDWRRQAVEKQKHRPRGHSFR
jgi:nucleoside 2-deoxyribosyltransferase